MEGGEELEQGGFVFRARVFLQGLAERNPGEAAGGGIPGSEHIRVSDDFLELPELPRRILFIGGGYISCEFAFVAAVAGAEVTILQRITNKHVYAIGDCAASGLMLAPVADEQGKLAARNILGGNVEAIDLSVVPGAVFTQPPIGSVGLTGEAAREKGLDFRVNSKTGLTWASSKRIGEKHSGYKVLIENTTGRILGAHLARHDAPEVINLFALAMKFGITAGQLADFPYAYPTMSSDVKYMVR